MPTKKILILSVIISLTSHIFIISLAGLIEMRGKPETREILTVDLKESLPTIDEKPAEKQQEQKETAPQTTPPPPAKAREKVASIANAQEETVDLGSTDEKYVPYLKKIKKKIERLWTYPQKASEQREEGTAVVRFTINQGGALTNSGVLETSGSNLLDQGALNVIKTAAPYDPLPKNFNLSKLHIVATFNYRLE